MQPDEIRIAEALAGCSFVPGSSQKRFVRQMDGRDRRNPLSDRQRAYLWAIAWSWRRQLPRDLVELARERSGGVGIPGKALLTPAEAAKNRRIDTTSLRTCATEGAGAQIELF